MTLSFELLESLESLDAEAADFDRAVLDSGAHGHFCSSADWILPAAQTLMPAREPWLFRLTGGYAAFMRGRHPRGFFYLEPLEAYWGLACPLVGGDVASLVSDFEDVLEARAEDWDVVVMSGLVNATPLDREIRARLGRRYNLSVAGHTARFVADLEDGFEGFLSRRSANTRRGLRKARRAARRAGVSFEAVASGDAAAIYHRILEVERRSWKGRRSVGLTEPPMLNFYRLMLPRLVRTGRLRLLFARRREQDVGYILGAAFGARYRGLQFSFDAEMSRYSVGNAMQLDQIERLAGEGVREYDLGATGGSYKARWADPPIASVTLLAVADR